MPVEVLGERSQSTARLTHHRAVRPAELGQPIQLADPRLQGHFFLTYVSQRSLALSMLTSLLVNSGLDQAIVLALDVLNFGTHLEHLLAACWNRKGQFDGATSPSLPYRQC